MEFLSNILLKAGLVAEGSTDLQGTSTALTVSLSDNSTKIATTAFVKGQGYLTSSSSLSWANVTGTPTTLAGYGITDAVPSGRTITINGTSQDLSANRSFSVGTVTSISTSGPLTGGTISTTGTIGITQATTSTDGYLSSTDWNTFNNKQAAGSYITALTGEATASGPGSATVTLSTSAVTGKLLTGLNLAGGGTIAATDSILQAFGKVQNQISGMVGGVTFQGTWDASTNTPTLTSSVGTKGYYYIVSVAGSTNLNGITDWKIGDWAIFNGSTWDKVDNTDAVSSVNGFTGAVSLTTSNIAEGTNLYYLDSRARLALSFTAGSGAYDNTTGVITIPTNTSQLTNGANFITLSSLSASSPLAYNSGTGAFSIQVATGSQNGYLSSTDWTTFNGKQNALTLTTTGSSGSSTLVGATLNVPTYTLSGLGGVPTSRQLTINGTAYDLSADRSWSVGTHTGSLTSGYIPKATGTTSLADSLVYDAGTAVLIGTTTASTSKFMVYSTTADNHYQAIGSAPSFRFADTITSPTYTGIVGLATASNHFIIGAAAGDMVLANNTTSSLGNFLFGTGTTERMRITPTGNVSINNTNNTYRFDVNGTVRFTGQLRLESTITNGTYTYTLPSATGTIALTSDISGMITGSGTTNYLPKFTGTSTIGNSIVQDNSTHIDIGGYALFTRAGKQTIINPNVGAGNVVADFGVGSGMGLTFTTDVERMRLTASGNLGLGVTPSAWMSGSTALQVVRGGLWHDGSGYIAMFNNAYYDGSNWRYIASTTASNYAQVNGNHQWFQAPSGTAGNAISFTQAMTLNASGNLSVGNTNDTYKLDVSGTGRFTSSVDATIANLSLGLKVTGSNLSSGTGAEIVYSSGKGIFLTFNRGAGTYLPTEIDGSTVTLSTSGTPRLTIASTGAATFSSTVTTGSGSGNTLTSGSIDVGKDIGLVATQGIVVNNARVLAFASTGAATFSSTITAASNITITNAARPYFIANTTNANEEAGIKIQQSTVSDWYIGTAQGSPSPQDLAIRDVKNSRIPLYFAASTGAATFSSSVTAGGLVTINKTNEGLILTAGANTDASYMSTRANNGTGWLIMGSQGSVGNYIQSGTGANESAITTVGAYALALGTNQTERMRITSGGSVGIGTTSPAYKLQVSSTAAEVMRLQGMVGNVSSNNTQLRFYGSASAADLWAIGTEVSTGSSGRAFDFYDLVAGANRMRLDASGNLGLGVTPSAWSGFTAMQVLNSSLSTTGSDVFVNANCFFNGSNWRYIASAAASQYYQDAGSSIWRIAPSGTAGNAISFTQAMTLNASGNLSIGNTNDTYKLDVTGTGRFTSSLSAVFNSTTNNPYIRFDQSGSAKFFIGERSAVSGDGGTGYDLYTVAGNDLRFFAGATKALTLATTGAATFSSSVTASSFISSSAGNANVFNSASATTGWVQIAMNNTSGSAILGIESSVAGTTTNGSLAYATILRNYTATDLQFATNNIVRATITSGGSVGIGTTSPSGKLDVFSSSDVYTNIYTSGNSTSAVLSLYNSSGVTDGAAICYNVAMRFGTVTGLNGAGFTERMRITSGGLVGIGTSSPTERLTIQGNSRFNYSDGYGYFGLGYVSGADYGFYNYNYGRTDLKFTQSTGAATFSSSVTASGVITISNTTNAYAYQNFGANTGYGWQIGKADNSTGIAPSNGFYIYDLTNSATRMVISQAGNVGIGTSSPISVFDVQVGPSTRRFLVNYDDSLITVKAASSNGAPETLRLIGDGIRFNVGSSGSGTEAMRLTSTGLGIGTSSPAGQFEVYTDVYRRLYTSNIDAYTIRLVLGANSYFQQDAGNEELRIAQQYGSGKITFYTGSPNAERMRITSGGALLINQSTSYHGAYLALNGKLHYSAVGGDIGGTIYSTWTQGSNGTEYYAGDLKFQYFTNKGSGYTLYDGMILDGAGRLGIGTNSPGTTLDISVAEASLRLTSTTGTNFTNQRIVNTGGTLWSGIERSTGGVLGITGAYEAFLLYGADNPMYIGTGNSFLRFGTNSTERMRITSGGRVGIGQTNPGTALSVAGQSEPWQLALTSVTGTAGAVIGSPSANVLAFGDWGGTERMRITSGGDVLVNATSTTQGAKFYVNGIGAFGSVYVGALGTGTVYSNAGFLTNTNPSDYRLKNTIKPLTYGLNEVLQLNPKTFYYNDDYAKARLKYGFIAQEVKDVMPDLVRRLGADTDYLGLENEGIFVTLVNAIKEQQTQINELKSQLNK